MTTTTNPTSTTEAGGFGRVTATTASGTADLRYHVAGAGPGLLLVNGTAAALEMWDPIAPQFTDSNTVVRFDYSGAGEATDDGGELSLQALADQAIAVADAAGLDRFVVAGHSLGAQIAAVVAAEHPDRVDGLIMHAGWLRTDLQMADQLRYWDALLAADPALFVAALPHFALGPRFWENASELQLEQLRSMLLEQLDAAGTRRQIQVDLATDLTEVLPRIACRTMVLSSRHDRLVDDAQQRGLMAALPQACQQGLDAGHGAPAEDPAAFADAVSLFLGGRA